MKKELPPMAEQNIYRFDPHVRNTLLRIDRVKRQILESMGIIVDKKETTNLRT